MNQHYSQCTNFRHEFRIKKLNACIFFRFRDNNSTCTDKYVWTNEEGWYNDYAFNGLKPTPETKEPRLDGDGKVISYFSSSGKHIDISSFTTFEVNAWPEVQDLEGLSTENGQPLFTEDSYDTFENWDIQVNFCT